MRFPQPVQSTTPCGRVFHEILHKLSLSTPQFFPFSTQKKLLHFSGFFPRMSCGEKVPGISGKKLGFHFSGVSTSTTISFLSFYSFFLQLRCLFSRIRRCLLETYNSKLFLQSGHICKAQKLRQISCLPRRDKTAAAFRSERIGQNQVLLFRTAGKITRQKNCNFQPMRQGCGKPVPCGLS